MRILLVGFLVLSQLANAQQLTEETTQLAATADPPLRWFCIDASAVDDVDYTAAETIRSLSSRREA